MAEMTQGLERPRGGGGGILLALLALAAVAGGLMLAAKAAPAKPPAGTRVIDGIIVQVDDNHADFKHKEAQAVRDACESNGTYQIYRERQYNNIYHRLCRLPDGRIGDWIVSLEKDGLKYENSAFVPKDGTLKNVIDWLLRKPAVRTMTNIFGH